MFVFRPSVVRHQQYLQQWCERDEKWEERSSCCSWAGLAVLGPGLRSLKLYCLQDSQVKLSIKNTLRNTYFIFTVEKILTSPVYFPSHTKMRQFLAASPLAEIQRFVIIEQKYQWYNDMNFSPGVLQSWILTGKSSLLVTLVLTVLRRMMSGSMMTLWQWQWSITMMKTTKVYQYLYLLLLLLLLIISTQFPVCHAWIPLS